MLHRLARRYDLGAVGLAGPHAAGTATRADPLSIFVAVDLRAANVEPFALHLGEITEAFVNVYDVRRLPWGHPLHLCVQWANVIELPRVPVPRGAVARIRHANGCEGLARLDTVPHFRVIDGPPPLPPGGLFCRAFPPPPVGGFLL